MMTYKQYYNLNIIDQYVFPFLTDSNYGCLSLAGGLSPSEEQSQAPGAIERREW